MVQTSGSRGGTPRTLFKIIVMLGLVLAGVAALAAEPEPTATTPSAACARTSFEFGGRVVQNGEATDTWTLTCWREPASEAANPPATPTPLAAVPVATQPVRQMDVTGTARF